MLKSDAFRNLKNNYNKPWFEIAFLCKNVKNLALAKSS
jgi:hypothetical protein